MEVVDSMQEAVDHIHKYGSSHTDVIITENGKWPTVLVLVFCGLFFFFFGNSTNLNFKMAKNLGHIISHRGLNNTGQFGQTWLNVSCSMPLLVSI